MPDALNHPRPALSGAACYEALMAGRAARLEEFDAHALACILAIGTDEAARGVSSLNEAVGLNSDELATLLQWAFPQSLWAVAAGDVAVISRSADEECLVDLLRQAVTSGAWAATWLAPMIARRAQRPDHLWQDLGLRARPELTAMMQRHFRILAARNNHDMKWKKYLYRVICGESGYALCTAPSCAECVDFDACFGTEDGESFLARSRRAVDRG